MIPDAERFQAAIQRFDAANREDPRKEAFEGKQYPQELLYAQRMTAWLERLAPGASELLRIAARCQHICRWHIPRNEYPMDRAGYLRWRTRLYSFHAEKAGEILQEVGYDDATIRRVQELVRKEHLKSDPEMQLLEDVICLVFLENYFSGFAAEHDAETLRGILRKTWRKMSPRGRQEALELPWYPQHRELLDQALGNTPEPNSR